MQNVCIDTNIWFYALAKPTDNDKLKHQIALELITKTEHPFITPQILNELTFNLLKKRAWDESTLRKLVTDLKERCYLLTPDNEWYERASFIRERYKLAFWDSLIVSSIQIVNCNVLFSEDMQHKLRIESLMIINPFI